MAPPLNAREFHAVGRLQSGMTCVSQKIISSRIAWRVAEPEHGRDSVMQTADAIAVFSLLVGMREVPSPEPVVARSLFLASDER